MNRTRDKTEQNEISFPPKYLALKISIWILDILLSIGFGFGQTAGKDADITVIDTNGESHIVTNLEAVYTNNGDNIGDASIITEGIFHMKLIAREGKAIITDHLEFPFSSISKLLFDRSKPGLLKEVIINFLDGSIIVVKSRAFEIIDGAGKKETRRLNSWSLATKQDYILSSFRGRLKAYSNEESEFFIPLDETTSIEFQ